MGLAGGEQGQGFVKRRVGFLLFYVGNGILVVNWESGRFVSF